MLPEIVWAMPRLGTFNLHASLLPQYRGAAPINWAIINGEKTTGITTFFLKHEIDTGDMILQESIEIGDDENVGSVHDRLMTLGARLVVKTVDLILTGNVPTTPQPSVGSEQLHPAPKIFKETCEIDFNKTAQQIHNFVRGLSPYPAAWATLSIADKEETVKIFSIKPVITTHNQEIGKVETDKKNYLRIACIDGYVEVQQLQVAGKKAMPINDFLNGLH